MRDCVVWPVIIRMRDIGFDGGLEKEVARRGLTIDE